MLMVVIGLVFLYFYLIMPRMRDRHDFTPFMGRHYAHRGLYDDAIPENSLGAFRLAVDKDYGIELDVQLSKDGEPVVIHDFSLKRMCGVDRQVYELSFDELRALRLKDSDEKIPHLNEVLELVNGKVPLIVELKLNSSNTNICEKVVPILDGYSGIYCIESFNPKAIIWYRKNRPNVIRGQLSTNFLKEKKQNNKLLFFLLQNLMFNAAAKPDFIAYNHIYKNMLSLLINRYIYRINTVAYTVGSMKELDKAGKVFDIYIFEGFLP